MSICHNSNDSLPVLPAPPSDADFLGLSGSQRKTAFAVAMNCEQLCTIAGLNSVGFVTLTVGDYHCAEHGKRVPAKRSKCPVCGSKMRWLQVFDIAEANKRFNSLRTGVLGDYFARAVVVSERHANNAYHFHMLASLVGLPDIRTGFNFRDVRSGDFSSVSPVLKKLWRQLRQRLPAYGFGRAEVKPIRKTGGAVACYVSNYVKKNVKNRLASDVGKKLVRYIGFAKTQLKANDFEWNTGNAIAWRERSRQALDLVGVSLRDVLVKPSPALAIHVQNSLGKIRVKCLDGSIAREVIGPKWAFLVSLLIDRLGLGGGDKLAGNFMEKNILSVELQRLAGRSWCDSVEHPENEVLCGESYSPREWRKMWEGLPLPSSKN